MTKIVFELDGSDISTIDGLAGKHTELTSVESYARDLAAARGVAVSEISIRFVD